VVEQELHAFDWFHRQQVERQDRPVEFAGGGTTRGQPAPQILAPGARCRPEVDHQLARPDQAHGLVDLLELERRPRPVALLLGLLDIGVVDVVVDPRAVDFGAFRLDLHLEGV
jgi:hypothetical protein